VIKTLSKTGNSKTLVINKEMIAHLGLTDDRIEVHYQDGRIVLARPQSLEEATAATLEQYGTAIRNLAK
jgi:antitoxin component of MazEF toxin-antitoxin module